MKMTIKITLVLLAFVMSVPTTTYAEDLVVFSGRKEPLIKPVIELFEKQTGIEVTLKTGKSTALGQQILQELPEPSADIYIAKESGSLEFLRSKNAFEIYESAATAKIPKKFKARDGSWIGVSGRSRAIIYNTDLVSKEDVPTTLKELTDPRWKGQLAAVNSGNESFVAWISALRINLGDQKTETLLNELKKNNIQLISKSHTDIRKSIGRGEFPLGLINHYYYHLQKNETDSDLRKVGIVYLDQGEGERGEIVNVSGAAIVKGAKNQEQAQKFIDFLASDDAQELFANVNYEYPLVANVPTNPAVIKSMDCLNTSALQCLNVMDVHLDQLGSRMAATLNLLDKVQWY